MKRKIGSLFFAGSIVALYGCGDPGLQDGSPGPTEEIDEVSEGIVRNLVVADATLRLGDFAETNYGTGKNLVKFAAEDFTRYSIFQLNLAGVPKAGRINFFAKGRVDKGFNWGIRIWGFDFQGAAWDESLITSNAFFLTALFLPATVWSGDVRTVSGPTDTWYGWNVTKFVNDAITAGRSNVTLLLASETDSDGPVGRFNSRDGGFSQTPSNVAPYLVFNSSPSSTGGFPGGVGMAPSGCDSSDMMGEACTVQPSQCTSGTTEFTKTMTCINGAAMCPNATSPQDFCYVQQGAATCGGACGNCDSQPCSEDRDCFPTTVCNQLTKTCSGRDRTTNRFICPTVRSGFCWAPGNRPSIGDVCVL